MISLATAIALPERIDGRPFPDRDLILFLTFGVIAVTLVGQGLTLAPLIRILGIAADDTRAREEREVRRAAARAALDRLDAWAARDDAPADLIDDLRMHHERRLARLDGSGAGIGPGGAGGGRGANRPTAKRTVAPWSASGPGAFAASAAVSMAVCPCAHSVAAQATRPTAHSGAA